MPLRYPTLPAARSPSNSLPPGGRWILRSKRRKEPSQCSLLFYNLWFYTTAFSSTAYGGAPSPREPLTRHFTFLKISFFLFCSSVFVMQKREEQGWREEQGLAATRSHFGSDSPPDCHSRPKCRFATSPTGDSVTFRLYQSTGLLFTPEMPLRSP